MSALAVQSQFANYIHYENNLSFDYSNFEQVDNDEDEEFYSDSFLLPELEIDEDITNINKYYGEFPPVLNFIMFSFLIKDEQRKIFMNKFGLRYLYYPKFREYVDGCCFLFIEGKYDSYHKTENDALRSAHERNYPGCDIHLSPMYRDIINEKGEIKISSIGYIKEDKIKRAPNETNIQKHTNGELDFSKIKRIDYLPYKIKSQYSIRNGDKIVNVTKSEEVIVDHGCTVSHVLFKDYIDPNTYKYNHLPFDKNNEVINNSNLTKPELLYLNELILHRKNTATLASGNYVNDRVEFFFKDETYQCFGEFENTVTTKCYSKICPVLTVLEKDLNNHNKLIHVRPNVEKTLMGLDSLSVNIFAILTDTKSNNQLETSTQSIFPEVCVMSLKEPLINEKIDPNDFFLGSDDFQNVYEIKFFKSGLKLYTNAINSVNCNGSEFKMSDPSTMIDDENEFKLNIDVLDKSHKDGELILEYITTKSLNLLVLRERPKYSTTLEIRKRILQSGDINGYVYKEREIRKDNKIIDYICIWVTEHHRNVTFVKHCKDVVFDVDDIKDYEILNRNTKTIMYVDKNLNEYIIA